MRPIDNLLDFIRNNSNWKDLLTEAPYYLKIKEDPNHKDCWMFSYDMIRTEWGDESFLTRACRGIVLKINWPDVEVVSYAFDKFFNMGETPAAKIDFEKEDITITSKEDGSLVKLSVIDDEFVWYTNNGFASNKFELSDIPSGLKFDTWQDLINYSLKGREKFFDKKILRNYTLFFELCTPENRIVIKHDDHDLIFLGARYLVNLSEVEFTHFKMMYPKIIDNFKTPIIFSTSKENFNLQGFKDFANSIPNNEGFVIYTTRDSMIHRVKVKADSYLHLSRLKDANGQITSSVVYDSIKDNTIDDIIGNFPEYKDYCLKMRKDYTDLAAILLGILIESLRKWTDIKDVDMREKKKQFAAYVMSTHKNVSSMIFEIPNREKSLIDILDKFIRDRVDYDRFKLLKEEFFHLNAITR